MNDESLGRPASERSLQRLIDDELAAGKLLLPIFSATALKLQRMKDRDDVPLDDVTAVIMEDQALAGRVLRMANSAFYSGLKQVDTVSGAVLRLGMERVSNLAMMAGQLLAHQARNPHIHEQMARLWARTYACSGGGRWVAQQCGLRDRAEEAFLACLLHDIGELYLLKLMEQLDEQKLAPGPLSAALLDEIVAELHASVGYRLMQKWELPEAYARIARDHHAGQFDESDPLMAITRLLDLAAGNFGKASDDGSRQVLAATPEAQVLGLNDVRLAQLEILLEDALLEAGELM